MKIRERSMPTPSITTTGDVPEPVVEATHDKVVHVLERFASMPVLDVHVRLIHEPNPAIERPSVAKASVDLNGRPMNAHVATETPDEVVDLLVARIRDQLEHVHRRLDARQHDTGHAEPGEWRHGDLPTTRPEWFDRPIAEREVVAHKTYTPEPATVAEALFDLEISESDFWLFVDAATGQDAALHRRSDGGFELQAPEPTPASLADVPDGSDVRLAAAPPPVLTFDEARTSLEASGLRFLFYFDAETGRGHVLYHRYDGHYGLIVPPS